LSTAADICQQQVILTKSQKCSDKKKPRIDFGKIASRAGSTKSSIIGFDGFSDD
jgi:hypothetical protein